jgi:hypothetical protein
VGKAVAASKGSGLLGKLGCLLMLALLWAGGQGVYEGLRNRSPETLTCEAAQAMPPPSTWVHLTGCRVNVLEAAYKTRFGVPTDDIFIPLKAGGGGDKAIRLVLATKDPDIVAVVKEMSALDGNDKKAFFSFLAKNARRLVRDKDVTGMVQSGIDKDDKIHRRLKEQNKDLADDFLVIDEGREPRLVWSLVLLGGGILLVVLLGAGAAGKKAAA